MNGDTIIILIAGALFVGVFFVYPAWVALEAYLMVNATLTESYSRAKAASQWNTYSAAAHCVEVGIAAHKAMHGHNCPNCGAPHEPVCSYCGTKP